MDKEKIVLIVDDNQEVSDTLKKLISKMVEERVVCASSGAEAEEIIRSKELLLAILDYKLPDTTGIELLKLIKSIDADAPVVMLTGFGTIESGIEAIKQGAYDYLLKPFHPAKIHAMVRGLVNYKKLKDENLILKEELGIKYSMGQVIGKSEKIQKIYDLMADLSHTDSTVLIQGESGTGKELLARSIHNNSQRKDKPFIVADCTILTESLLESELFGHEKGAFTGAIRKKMGRFEQADGGTIFLDEVADFSAVAQLKLLRVIQERNFERVGGEETIETDVRIIAATNKDIKQLIAEGKFREDLYYRINIIPIFMPALRDRKEDVKMLADEFLEVFAKKNSKEIRGISNDAYKALIDYSWPGNVRELENTIERAVVIAKGNVIDASDLPGSIIGGAEPSSGKSSTLQGQEKSLIIKVLTSNSYNLSKSAKELGVSRSTLYGKMRKFGISK